MISQRDVSSNWKSVPWGRVFGREIVADRLFLRSALIRKDLLPRYAPAHMPLTYAVAGAAAAAAAAADYAAGGGGALNPAGVKPCAAWHASRTRRAVGLLRKWSSGTRRGGATSRTTPRTPSGWASAKTPTSKRARAKRGRRVAPAGPMAPSTRA